MGNLCKAEQEFITGLVSVLKELGPELFNGKSESENKLHQGSDPNIGKKGVSKPGDTENEDRTANFIHNRIADKISSINT